MADAARIGLCERIRATAKTAALPVILVTSLETGSGGMQYSTQFIGQRRFASHADTIVTSVPPNSTEDDRRRSLARTFKHVLVRYATTTSAVSHLNVVYDASADSSTAATTRDPWDFWVFRISGNGFFNGESQTKSANLSGNISASRTTGRASAAPTSHRTTDRRRVSREARRRLAARRIARRAPADRA